MSHGQAIDPGRWRRSGRSPAASPVDRHGDGFCSRRVLDRWGYAPMPGLRSGRGDPARGVTSTPRPWFVISMRSRAIPDRRQPLNPGITFKHQGSHSPMVPIVAHSPMYGNAMHFCPETLTMQSTRMQFPSRSNRSDYCKLDIALLNRLWLRLALAPRGRAPLSRREKGRG